MRVGVARNPSMASTRTRALALGGLAAVVAAGYVIKIKSSPRTPAPEPAASASASAQPDDGGLRSPLPDAQASYRRVEPKMRACFHAQQARRRQYMGRALFVLEVDSNGRVTSAKLEGT